ncbi:MAG TPA: methylenetetrahydrofolate reductase [Gaiellaceae bacterium]|nr:methylenetetrahydrofolate reductase [Gaiellaceae bacterium]
MDRAAEGVVSGFGRLTVAEALARPRYEVIPLDGVEEAVLAHVPTDVTVTVTTSPAKGLEATLALAERLAAHGYDVVPHLAARNVRDRAQLAELSERLRAAGARDVLVMAGDAKEPAGDFEGAQPLLRALDELGRPFEEVGITGYPESHAIISDGAAVAAMREKERYATYIVSQICFAHEVTASWLGDVWQRGTRLPVLIGLPGPVEGARLLRVCERIRVGPSISILRADECVKDGAFDPDLIVDGLEESIDHDHPNFGGFHIFTFNELADTERWRQRHLAAETPAS